MKNKLIYGLFALLAIALTSCGGESPGRENPVNANGIKISGNVEGANSQMAYLYRYEEDGMRLVDSTLVENGEFTLYTDTKEFREYLLQFGRQDQNLVRVNNYVYLIPDEQSTTIEINGSFPGIGDNYSITGCPNSSDFKDYIIFARPYYASIDEVKQKYNAEVDTNILKVYLEEMDSIQQYVRDYAIDYINEKPGSPVSWVMLKEFYPPVGLDGFDTTAFAYFDKVRDAMAEKYPYSNYPSYIDQSKANTIAQLDELKLNPDGDLAPEIALENPDGEIIKLSSLRGKVVLIDFWASWCGPCRLENPNVVKTYNEYKDKGFTVYSVSLDEKKDAWVKAIEADNLVWPNHVSDLKGWQSDAAQAYGVNSIPATFLLDRNGKVIDSNLRGGRLEQKLQEILG